MTHEDTINYHSVMRVLLMSPNPGEALEVFVNQEREVVAHNAHTAAVDAMLDVAREYERLGSVCPVADLKQAAERARTS